jgi:hypothetical protein
MKTIILQTLVPVTQYFGNLANHPPLLRRSFLIPLMLVCFALCQQVQSATDTPDPGPVPFSNTADGHLALGSVTTGIYNAAFGTYSLLSLTDGSFCTAVGGATLMLNTGSENTAVGAGALLSNTAGSSNTAVGAFAGFSNSGGTGDTAIGNRALQNDTGGSNTATGFHALLNNLGGFNNAAFGIRPLEFNTDGNNNTAVGNLALNASLGSDNVALGRLAGSGITTVNNNIVIGHGSGVNTALGQLDNSCYIDNIANQPISTVNFVGIVGVDIDGKLGTFSVDANGNKVPLSSLIGQPQVVPKGAKPQAIPDAQALNRKVQALEATVAELRGQLKEQAAQIQKVSAQLEVSKPAAQVVSSER